MRLFFKLLFVLLCVFFLSELLVRLVLTLPASDKPDIELGFLHKPNAVILHTREGYAINKMNAMGFNDVEPLNDSEKTNIVLLGDSISEALQVPQSKNFTSQVEDRSSCLDIYNVGRGGMSPVHYPIVLDRVLNYYSPKLTVIVISFGDIIDIKNKKYEVIREENTNVIVGLKIKEIQLSKLRVKLDYVISHSALVTYLIRRLRESLLSDAAVTNVNSTDESTFDEDPYEILLYLFKGMQSKAPIAILYHPEINYLVNRKAEVTAGSKSFELIVKKVAKTINAPFLSTENYMIKSYMEFGQPGVGFSNKNILGGHMNELGHRATAGALFQLIKNAGLTCNVQDNENKI